MNFLFILAQVISIIGFIFYVFSIQCDNKKKLLTLQLVSNFLYSSSYLMLNAISAFFIGLVSFIRCILFRNVNDKNKKNSVLSLVILLFLSILVGIFTVKSLLDIIPIVISIVYILSTWQNNMKLIRYSFIFTAILWIIYNLYVGAYSSLIGNLFEIISGVIAIFRFQN